MSCLRPCSIAFWIATIFSIFNVGWRPSWTRNTNIGCSRSVLKICLQFLQRFDVFLQSLLISLKQTCMHHARCSLISLSSISQVRQHTTIEKWTRPQRTNSLDKRLMVYKISLTIVLISMFISFICFYQRRFQLEFLLWVCLNIYN